MKTKLFFVSLLLIVFAFTIDCKAENGKIIFYRESSIIGSSSDYKIFVNDTVMKIRNGSYNELSCTPGDYIISIKNSPAMPIRLNVADNKSYYVRFILYPGFWSTIPELILVDSISAKRTIHSRQLKDFNNKTLWIHPRHQIGVNLEVGVGFENTTMAMTTDNTESKISAGGGIGIGVKYAYQFSKHFEGDVDLNYKYSELQPYLNNASVSFSRTNLSVTPLYVFPLGDGYMMRLKIGAGPDYVLSPHLDINTVKLIGGERAQADYNSAFGFHVRTIFEMYFGQNWSFIYGLNWTNVNYDAKTYIPSEFNKRDGSGIDFMTGIYYSF
ncbi:MAG: hypothetical protein PHV20_09490 [Bacteroidales bacterium]|nr:hypothetical protein [Bacteroidales bacterium]